MEHQEDIDTPPASPPPPMEQDDNDSAPPPPPAAGGVVMPLTKEAIENFLRCQLDTHLNDATPRDRKDEELERKKESWQLPPGLQKHSSANKSKRGDPAKEEIAKQPEVPGVVDESNEAELKAKLEAQRVALLQRRLADQEKQTKMLLDRLQGRNSNPSVQDLAPTNQNGIAGRRGRDRDQKHRFEQVLIEKANRAKQRLSDPNVNTREPRRSLGTDADPQEVSPRPGSASRRGRSRSGSIGSGDDATLHADGYSRDRAVDTIERSDTASSADMKADIKRKRSKGNKDGPELPAVDEKSKMIRTESGTEIDLETGLPVQKKGSGFSWFYAIGFMIFLASVTYASIIILQRV